MIGNCCLWTLCVIAVALYCVCPLQCQYGYYGPDAYYIANENDNGNPFDTPQNATQGDEDLQDFIKPIITPTTIYLRSGGFSVGGAFSYQNYIRYNIDGEGTFWNETSGIGGVWIDLRPIAASGAYKGNPFGFTSAELQLMGVTVNSNGTVTYSLTFVNELSDFDLVHNHGQLGGFWSDGTPYISASPQPPGATWTNYYTIDPTTNSGTYFIHSHYGFGSTKGLSAPLIIQYLAPSTHPMASILNDVNTAEVLLYLEDWCLVYTNADDFYTAGDNYTDYHTIRDPYICENPQLAYRAVWGEWNSEKGVDYLGSLPYPQTSRGQFRGGTLYKCDAPTVAPEFGFSYFMANDRTYDEPQTIQLNVTQNVRLRIINAGRMTSFKVNFPASLGVVTVVATDGHYTQPYSLGVGGYLWAGSAMRYDVVFTLPATPGEFPIIAYEEAPAPLSTDSPGFAPFEVSHTAGIILYTTANVPTVNPIPFTVNGTGMLSQNPQWIIEQEGSLSAFTNEQLGWNHLSANVKLFQIASTGYNGIYAFDFQPGMQIPPIISYQQFVSNVQNNQFMGTPIVVNPNDQVCLNFTNYQHDTHPIHLHGHKFQVTEINGNVVSGPVRDTFYLPSGRCQNVIICFNADNVGGGMHALHCHMVVHELAGMMTVVEYSGYTTFQPDGELIQCAAASTSTSSNSPTTVGLAVGLVLGLIFLASLIGNCVLYKKAKIYAPLPPAGKTDHPTAEMESRGSTT